MSYSLFAIFGLMGRFFLLLAQGLGFFRYSVFLVARFALFYEILERRKPDYVNQWSENRQQANKDAHE